jgi:DNA processing protein
MSDRHRTDDAALDWLGLALVAPLTPRRALTLVERFGAPGAVLAAPVAALAAAGVPAAVASRLGEARRAARTEAQALAAQAATLVTWGDADYPSRLRDIAEPPLALAIRGVLGPAEAPAVAVVGARRASEYGRRMAAEIAGGLAQAGLTVVSGLAAGIDAAAHRAALAAGGRTVAVLGTGIDRVYPSWHAELAGEIVRQGALVSEFPCGTPPLPFNFPRRNRLISGLTLGTVVIEAADRSGSLITVGCALEQGREVFALPGPVGLAAHRGTHRLIREGARLVTSAEDILQELAPALVAQLVAARGAAAAAGLTPAERRLLDVLGPDGRHVDDVIRRASVPAGTALETLLALELRGLVVQLPGKRFRRQAA